MVKEKEDLFPMEIRVIIDLPEDIFDDYSELKRKRKLTGRIQEAVTTFEREDSRAEAVNEVSVLSGVEESLLKMSDSIVQLIDNSNKDRENLNNVVTSLIQRQELHEEKVMGIISNLTAVFQSNQNSFNNQNTGVTTVNNMPPDSHIVTEVPIVETPVEDIKRKAPDSGTRRKLASMMDI